ncbi:unnamed protein product (macronuclear) [Paramecium tetraurelia]|uniref:Uncharacterized protein n=1 Tax=Paramecium tetraurelia TaxID=5888 RepID=A0EI05_PARTE|nr:uncharacterized protein GSPATT00027273001 [Paramecium tetraurelia]CAK94946.1 unnamed protein product [Paramecium tetraurelia]|eukprot:XP_001462319.1 hypothetical protein (macronuclear) [Paramecium tetraurelia strain d4-2]
MQQKVNIYNNHKRYHKLDLNKGSIQKVGLFVLDKDNERFLKIGCILIMDKFDGKLTQGFVKNINFQDLIEKIKIKESAKWNQVFLYGFKTKDIVLYDLSFALSPIKSLYWLLIFIQNYVKYMYLNNNNKYFIYEEIQLKVLLSCCKEITFNELKSNAETIFKPKLIRIKNFLCRIGQKAKEREIDRQNSKVTNKQDEIVQQKLKKTTMKNIENISNQNSDDRQCISGGSILKEIKIYFTILCYVHEGKLNKEKKVENEKKRDQTQYRG